MTLESTPPAAQEIRGRTVLVVEDEPLVSFLVEDTLLREGAKVWIATGLDDALRLLSVHLPDAAVLDVNLGAGALVYPIAERLDETGIPFIFASGYGQFGLPQRWAGYTVIAKPFNPNALVRALVRALTG